MPPSRRYLACLLGALLAGFACVLLAGSAAEHLARRTMAVEQRHRLEVHALGLENAIARYEALPYTSALHPDVAALLRAGSTNPALTQRVDTYLEDVARQGGALVLYLLDRNGLTLASSNWHEPGSYVGQNFAFRPYFQDASQHERGHFYAVGSATGLPGYFISQNVRQHGESLGVLVVKVSLDSLVTGLAGSEPIILVLDADGIAFLSSLPQWQMRARHPLDSVTRRRLAETRQYGDSTFEPLPWTIRSSVANEGTVLDVTSPRRGQPTTAWLLSERLVAPQGWTIAVLDPDREAIAAGWEARAGTAILLALAGTGLFAWRQRERRLAIGRRARIALEAAQATLECRIAERTRDLTKANASLQTEVGERARAERALREAQDRLVQAAKLAVIGQMATGITHELNQPLAALDSLAMATSTYVDQGDLATTHANLHRMRDLVRRMGRITSQLRGFARKSRAEEQSIDPLVAIANAQALLEAVWKRQGVEIGVHANAPPSLRVRFESIRLEQVLVNLLRNALDAVRDRPDPRVQVTLRCTTFGGEERIHILVDDNGPGVPAQARDQLFDPFFTTKRPGEGLGLGLAISRSLAADFGAHLTFEERARDRHSDGIPLGGSRFVLDLQRGNPS